MELREPITLIAGQTLDCTTGAYSGKKVVALSPVGVVSKVCARAYGNTTGKSMDYANAGVFVADGSTAADLAGFTPFPYGFDKVVVPAGSTPVICWLEFAR